MKYLIPKNIEYFLKYDENLTIGKVYPIFEDDQLEMYLSNKGIVRVWDKSFLNSKYNKRTDWYDIIEL
jgi:hypothetical protein